LDQARGYLGECPAEYRGPEWQYLDRMCRAEVMSFPFEATYGAVIAYSPDGQHIATRGRVAQLWNLVTRAETTCSARWGTWSPVLAFTPDGRRLMMLYGNRPGIRINPIPREKQAPLVVESIVCEVVTGRVLLDAKFEYPTPAGARYALSPAG